MTYDPEAIERAPDGHPLHFVRMDDSPALARQREETRAAQRAVEEYDEKVDAEARRQLDEEHDEATFTRDVARRKREIAGR